jgi:hypothetical protein
MTHHNQINHTFQIWRRDYVRSATPNAPNVLGKLTIVRNVALVISTILMGMLMLGIAWNCVRLASMHKMMYAGHVMIRKTVIYHFPDYALNVFLVRGVFPAHHLIIFILL